MCRAVELDSRFEALALLQCAQDTCAADERAQVPGSFSRYRRRVSAELVVLPALVEDLEVQIERAWRRLDVVSPKISD